MDDNISTPVGVLSSSQNALPAMVRVVATEIVKPATPTRTPRLELAPWDLLLLSAHYIQKGHLFSMPPTATSAGDIKAVLARLKTSLSLALVHFFPLAGRLATTPAEDGNGSFVYVDCSDQGAGFIHAVADGVTVADVMAEGKELPLHLLRKFFAMDLAVNYDGHDAPLLTVQVTELVDGVFVGCAFNHAIGDGTSFWHFFNAWAEISRILKVEAAEMEERDKGFDSTAQSPSISRPPVHDRWFYDGRTTPIRMPFRNADEVLERLTEPPCLHERVFHFSPQSMAALKAKANSSLYVVEHASGKGITISSFQSLSALLWRAITRSRCFPEDQRTSCRLAIENRSRLRPPLSPDYFGNSIYAIPTTTTAGELLAQDLGWTAWQLNRTIAAYTDHVIRDAVVSWTAAPFVVGLSWFDPFSIHMGSSPRFDMYGCDFGWGRAVALRSGAANKFDGKVSAYPGREGAGSVDLEVCLPPKTMAALEFDVEFMAAVSPCSSG